MQRYSFSTQQPDRDSEGEYVRWDDVAPLLEANQGDRTMLSTITRDDVRQAVRQLSASERGRLALYELRVWTKRGLMPGLDEFNQEAVVTLFLAGCGPLPGTVREEIDAAI